MHYHRAIGRLMESNVAQNEPASSSRQRPGPIEAAPTSLPKGGGAVRGIDEKLTASPVTGTANVSVPIPTPPGRGGFEPRLALSYDSGSGNGPFGFGWSLSLASVARKTDKGLPRYQDESESDVFVISGSEDLVPVLVPDATGAMRRHAERRTVAGERFEIQRYCPRIEGLFARIERWTNRDTGESHWRSISRDNVTTLYGRTAESRVADPGDQRRIFSWLICDTRDDKGNAIHYRYTSEDLAGVDQNQIAETHRLQSNAFTNRYLKRVLYGNRTPCTRSEDLAARSDWMFEIVLDYGEHDATAPGPNDEVVPRPGQTVPVDWGIRLDPFSSYRSGFDVRAYRLCRRILVFHHFPSEADVGANCLVRSLSLEHRQSPIATVLRRVVSAGFRRTAAAAGSLPPLDFEYSTSDLLDAAATPSFEVKELPLDSVENLPVGIDAPYQWADLDGEGLSGVLTDIGGAWLYKRNLGAGRFARTERLALAPALDATGPMQLLDLDGDGQIALVELSGPTPGFYEREGDGWVTHQTFDSHPVLDWNDPNLRFLDLTGDGHADILIAQDEAFTWHPSLGADGFGSGERTSWAADEEGGPRLVFADGSDTIFLADMSGDGLTDLVRVRNGEVCYWPNIGYGRFAAKVKMSGAPWFDAPDVFDPRRLRFADVDGSGVTDLLYLGRGGVDIYLNQSGNSWSPARPIALPLADTLSSVQVIDLLGKGTPCLVWSTALPGEAARPLRYVDVMTTKPHLLTAFRNNLGAETRLHYAPSTKFYCDDRDAGRPWITKLPFPVHVVERVETRDHISGNRFVSRYAYHHGYFDGHEREFRGFGMVEQFDSEQFAVLDGAPLATNVDAASQVPPVLTKTWFHTGVYIGGEHVSDFHAGLLDASDTGEYFREPGVSDAEARRRLLPDTVMPAGMTVDERREACRALKGVMLRQETYALDDTLKAATPYVVTEQNFTIRRVQPHGPNRHAVFFTHPREAIAYQYERNPADPRTTHTLTLEVDEYGNVLTQAAIGYGRRQPDAGLPDQADRDAQLRLLVTCTVVEVSNAIDLANDYRTSLSCDTRTYELTGYAATGAAGRFQHADFVQSDAAAPARLALIFDGETNYQDQPGTGRQRRLIERIRTLYRSDDLTRLLPPRQLEPLALTGESYKLALTPGIVSDVFSRRRAGQPNENLLPAAAGLLEGKGADQGGYVAAEGGWWIPSGRTHFDAIANIGNPAATAAQELTTARQHFFLPRKTVDPFDQVSFVDYDPHDLFAVRTVDAIGNTTLAAHDYRVLQPALVTDANGNRTAVAFDALGLVVATAVMGKVGQNAGDELGGFNADPSLGAIQSFVADPHTHAASLLGRATTRIVYDVLRFVRSGQPPVAATLARETHFHDAGGVPTNIRVTFAYSDGLGREIQTKIPAELGNAPQRQAHIALPTGDIRPGDLVRDAAGAVLRAVVPRRWIGTGRTVFNNKGKPIRQYEPFFSATPLYETEREMTDTGVSSTLFYDPVGRVVATLHPDHNYDKIVFDSWQQATFDVTDTIKFDPRTDADVRAFFVHADGTSRVAAKDYLPTWLALRTDAAHAVEAARRWPDAALQSAERDAALQATVHENTPTRAHLDALGRTFLTMADNGADPASPGQHLYFSTRVEIDIEGNQRAIRDAVQQNGDPLGRIVMRYRYDMLGNRLHQQSMEAGERWILSDLTGKPIRAFDSRRSDRRVEYDALRRPTGFFVSDGGAGRLAEQTVYGESLGAAGNHRGRVYQVCDAAGEVIHVEYDFKGNLRRSERRLLVDYKTPANWNTGPVLEGGAAHISATTYDALNRAITITSPDRSVYRATFNEGNLLERVDVNLRGAAVATSFVTSSDYDAKGQRERVVFGNGATTTSSYDPFTFRLVHLKTTRTAAATAPASQILERPSVVQDLRYTYDPVGNIASIADAALKTIVHNGQQVQPVSTFEYDAVYRLIVARGREHIGQMVFDFDPPNGHFRDYPFAGNHAHPNDLQALRKYAEHYAYDPVGNFTSMRHLAAGGDWTRVYDYAEPSLLEPAKTSNRLTKTTVGNPPNRAEACSHDAHGNMTAMLPHLPSLVWDFKDQLQRVALGGGGTAYYVYDASGARVRTVIESQTGTRQKERLYLGSCERYREFNGAGTTVMLARESLHVVDDKRRIALVETQTIVLGSSVATPLLVQRYQLGNHLGSASVELDDSGALVSYEEYHPYGTTSFQGGRSAAEVSLKRYRYTGKERDQETGFGYHGGRYYAPWIGRWTSGDPGGIADGVNVFAYVRGAPTRLVDHNGRDATPAEADLKDQEVLAHFPSPEFLRAVEDFERKHVYLMPDLAARAKRGQAQYQADVNGAFDQAIRATEIAKQPGSLAAFPSFVADKSAQSLFGGGPRLSMDAYEGLTSAGGAALTAAAPLAARTPSPAKEPDPVVIDTFSFGTKLPTANTPEGAMARAKQLNAASRASLADRLGISPGSGVEAALQNTGKIKVPTMGGQPDFRNYSFFDVSLRDLGISKAEKLSDQQQFRLAMKALKADLRTHPAGWNEFSPKQQKALKDAFGDMSKDTVVSARAKGFTWHHEGNEPYSGILQLLDRQLHAFNPHDGARYITQTTR